MKGWFPRNKVISNTSWVRRQMSSSVACLGIICVNVDFECTSMFSIRARHILNVISTFNKRCSLVNAIRNTNGIRSISGAFIPQYLRISCSNLEICKRYKHKESRKGKKKFESVTDSEEENEHAVTEDWDGEIVDKQTKVVTLRVNSLRADLILKAGLGIARNKIESMFYESKIRVNGQKLLKKSAMLSVGDEVDIVRGSSLTNPDFLTVSRVEILAASERGDGLTVKIRRNKALTIENYQQDPYKI